MVITVTCPSCTSAFPVDPAKIPEGGVNARCTQCNDVFRVEKPADPEPVMDLPTLDEAPAAVEQPAAPAPPEEAFTAPPAAAPEPPPEPAAPASDPFAEPAPFEAPAAPVAEAPAPPPLPDPIPVAEPAPPAPPAPEATPAEPAAVQGFTFGKRDPTDKAKRLARVLVSDMIMYNAERHQSALAGGTLVEDFEEEIQKSWKEYVEQVGEELANGVGRQFWTEALNDILAKGQDIF